MKKQTAGFRTAAILLLGLATAARAAIDVQKVANPRTSNGGWVEDAGKVLGPEYIALINAVAETLKTKTTAEFAVVTVDNLGGLAIEDFAARLFKQFGIGAAGKENGLLLLFSRDDRRVRLEVGYGLEGTIPDAAASRLLDEQALPFFREGQYGRGLYAAAKAAAGMIGAAAGVPLDLADPSVWPAPLPIPATTVEPPPSPMPESAPKPDPRPAALISGIAVLLFVLLGSWLVARRVSRKKAKMAKEKALGGGNAAVIALLWTGSVIGFIILAVVTKSLLPSLLSFGLVPAAATFGQVLAMKSLRRKVSGYQAPCGNCGKPMRLLDEQADDAFLSAEEIAEESAGGMNYEVWQCEACGASERFAIKLGKAAACPQCKRRTLVTTTTTLVAATAAAGGKIRVDADCKNPSCDYHKVHERNTARLGTPTSGSTGRGSFSGGSSHSSFGGGRSGGGGASKGW
jgi:uncharacterized protein